MKTVKTSRSLGLKVTDFPVIQTGKNIVGFEPKDFMLPEIIEEKEGVEIVKFKNGVTALVVNSISNKEDDELEGIEWENAYNKFLREKVGISGCDIAGLVTQENRGLGKTLLVINKFFV